MTIVTAGTDCRIRPKGELTLFSSVVFEAGTGLLKVHDHSRLRKLLIHKSEMSSHVLDTLSLIKTSKNVYAS